jgi:hypothetical protein
MLISPFLIHSIHGQGCSDAGACSIGTLDEVETEESILPRVKISYDQGIALGEKFTFISQTSISLDLRVGKSTSIVVRTPFIFTSGNLGNSSGIGDVLISVIQQVYKDNESQFGILLAGKLKSNNSNFSFAGNPLPMAYQTSLGTYDIIVGGQYLWRTWDFYLAYQHPFGRNENQYLNNPNITDESKIYFESAQLKRGDDLALRVQKTFYLNNDQSLLPGIMPIYRIQKSEIVKNDQQVLLDGSDGLTLNLYLTYVKKLKGNTIMYLSGAFPIIDRDYRADGLTRNFVINLKFTQLW